MAIVIGSPVPADKYPLDEYLPAIQMRLETRRGCSCLLQSRVLNYGRYSGDYDSLILWVPWAKYKCTLILKTVCWQCNVLVLTLDQEVCTALSLFSSLLTTWPTALLTESQIEQVWVFPLLYGLPMAWADMVDTGAPLENIDHPIYICTNAFSVYDTDRFWHSFGVGSILRNIVQPVSYFYEHYRLKLMFHLQDCHCPCVQLSSFFYPWCWWSWSTSRPTFRQGEF